MASTRDVQRESDDELAGDKWLVIVTDNSCKEQVEKLANRGVTVRSVEEVTMGILQHQPFMQTPQP